MNRHLRIFGAGLLAVGVSGLTVGSVQAQDTPGTPQQPTEQREERGLGGLIPGRAPDADQLPVSATEANNIRGTLATATEAAMTRGQLRSVAQRLTTPDESRLNEFVRQDHPQLDEAIERLQQAWRDRYGQDFNIRDRAAVYPAEIVQIRLGLTDQAVAARDRGTQDMGVIGERPAGYQPGQDRQEDRDGAAARIEGQVGDVGARAEVGTDRDRDRDAQPAAARDGETQSNVVTVIFPASHDLPEIHVPLVNEGTLTDTWRIDIPLNVDGQKVHDNLVRFMNKSIEKQDQWPQDANEAYRMATHMVMASLFDAKADHDARPAGERMGEDRTGETDRPQTPVQPTEPGQVTEPGQQPGQTDQPR